MNDSHNEAYNSKRQEVAREYEARGYRVLIEPGPNDLPESLARFRPDLIARGSDETVLVEIKVGTQTAATERYGELAEEIQAQPGWRFELVVVDTGSREVPPSTEDLLEINDIAARVARANELSEAGADDAAFLLLWASAEGLLRHLAIRDGLPLQRMPTSALVKELYSQGAISRQDLADAERALATRNSLAHGFQVSRLGPDTQGLKGLAQRLLSDLAAQKVDAPT